MWFKKMFFFLSFLVIVIKIDFFMSFFLWCFEKLCFSCNTLKNYFFTGFSVIFLKIWVFPNFSCNILKYLFFFDFWKTAFFLGFVVIVLITYFSGIFWKTDFWLFLWLFQKLCFTVVFKKTEIFLCFPVIK